MKKIFTFLFMALLAVGMTTAKEVTFDITSIYASTATGTAVTGDTIDEVTVTYSNGNNKQNSPKYYTIGTSIRLYAKNTFTIASTGSAIEKVVLTRACYAANVFTASTGTFTDEGTTDLNTYTDVEWTGSESSITFTVSGSTGNARIQKIVVTLAEEEETVEEAYVLTATSEPSLDPTAYYQMNYDEEAGYFLASGVNIASLFQGSGYFGITTKLGETIEEIASYMLGFESNGYEVTNFVGSSFDEATGVAVTPAVSNAAKVAAGVYDIYMYVQEATAIAPKRVNLLAEEASWYVKVVSTGETGVSDLTNVSSIDNVKYYNMAGVESNEPMDGVNIRVITFTDGSKATDKVIR